MNLCNVCGKSFSSKTILKRHINTIHDKSAGFSCEECGKSFQRKDSLKRHCSTKHPPQPQPPLKRVRVNFQDEGENVPSDLLHQVEDSCRECYAENWRAYIRTCQQLQGNGLLLNYWSAKSLATLGDRSFQCAAPKLWNCLPFEIRNYLTLSSFKKSLKTY